jgi:hypothetical protein
MTSYVDWDPCLYDKDIYNLEEFHDPSEVVYQHDHFDHYGEYCHCTVATHHTCLEEEFSDACEFLSFNDQVDDLMDTFHFTMVSYVYGIHNTEVSKVAPKFELLHPLFGWAPADTINRTFDVTTRYARGRISDTLKQHWRSRFPACNVKRRNEPVATDTVFSDIEAVDSGVKAAQIFVGRESLVADVYGLKTN